MKKTFFITLCLLVWLVLNKQCELSKLINIKPLAELKVGIQVSVTMYYAEVSQCDADPLVTAGMYKINPKRASEHKFVALSRDLLKRFGGIFCKG